VDSTKTQVITKMIMTTITTIMTMVIKINILPTHTPRRRQTQRFFNQVSFVAIVLHRRFQAQNFATHVVLLPPWFKIVPVAVQSYLPTHPSAHNVGIIMDKIYHLKDKKFLRSYCEV